MADELLSTEFVEWLTEVAHRDETELLDLTTMELADLWSRLDALRDIVATAQGKVTEALAPKLVDGPVMLSDGSVLKRTAAASRTQWRNEALLEAVFERATRYVVDPDTGQQIALVDPARVRGLLAPSKATTKLRALGIDYREYCHEDWTERVEVVR